MKLTKPSPGLIAEFKAVVAQLPQGELAGNRADGPDRTEEREQY